MKKQWEALWPVDAKQWAELLQRGKAAPTQEKPMGLGMGRPGLWASTGSQMPAEEGERQV